jgi:hypothetical protein
VCRQKKSHITHVVNSELGETCMIYQTYPVNELPGTQPNSQGLGQLFQALGHLAEFTATQPILLDKTKHSATLLPSDTKVAGNLLFIVTQ